MRRITWGVWLLASIAAACSAESRARAPERLCTPGAYVFCLCRSGGQGTKLCADDGQTFGACLPCEDGDGTGIAGQRRPKRIAQAPDPESRDPNDAGGARDAGTDGAIPNDDAVDGGIAQREGGAAGPVDGTSELGCSSLENIASTVELELVADHMPAARGGRARPGRYVQTWLVEFTGGRGTAGPGGLKSRDTLELGLGEGRYVTTDELGRSETASFDYAVDGPYVTVRYRCGRTDQKRFMVDADERQIVLYDPPIARFFVRQEASR